MDHLRVTIQSLAHGGDGVGRLPDGRAVFVPAACPGDELDIDIVEDHGRWARAAIAAIVSPSADRVTPPCPYFGMCGGCQWQHVAYSTQLASKRQAISDALERIGGCADAAVGPTIESPEVYGYRNKIELSAAPSPAGLTLGLARAGTHDVLPIDACLLLPERARRLPKALSGALRFLSARGALGILRATLRVSAAGEIAVDLWTSGGPFPRAAVAKTVAEATGARTVTRVIVKGALERRDISQVEALVGPPTWSETLDTDHYAVSAPSFFQVNTAAASLLRDVALRGLGADGTMRVGDLYAGVGTFTLPIARAAGEAVAVEMSRYALADLRRNLDHAGLAADIVPGDPEHALPDIGHLDAVLVDPPRAGLSATAIDTLIAARIPRIVYVSCDPATLARDTKRLLQAGYAPAGFTPVDLFPQTYHVETVGVFDRR